MTTPDPDAVQVLAAQLHADECRSAAGSRIPWSSRHHNVHHRKAERLLSGLAEAGHYLTTMKES